MVVATNPFQSDLISQNQLFKASHRSLKSLTLFKTLQDDEKRRNFHLDRQDKLCENLAKPENYRVSALAKFQYGGNRNFDTTKNT